MNTIIAATDYSELAENAVEYAAGLAKQNKVRLILLNDFTIPVTAMNARVSASAIQELLDENELRLEKRASFLAGKYDIEVVPKATFSFVEDEMKLLILNYNADLIVMGMVSKTLEQELLGNTTTSVIKKLKSPVLAVPLKAKFAGSKKMLFACDVLNGVSAALLANIKGLALSDDADVEVLLINETIEELKTAGADPLALSKVGEGLEGITYHYKHIRSDSIIDCIEKEIIRYQADLLIMVPEKHGFWDSIIHRSKTRMMASGLNIPLLSIPV